MLIAVHVAIAIHIWHWKSAGTTLSPVEPSESMQTLETGLINAGFIFFGVAILSTLILGRWFCGWGCHLVALQDCCSWLLKKVGIRPKAIRSRFLVWVPVFAAFYMFIWPQFARMIERRQAPPWVWHLTTTDFWATFPNWQISLLTFFVCGFVIVYLLGNKGFCTYGCPYGGLFYWADKVAPGKIRVTEACNQCGHCTAVCTSNVRVHEEVNLHKMVVDAGCMKCFDCVDACPNDALYFGFGSPRPSKKALSQLPIAQSKLWDYSWPEEFALAGLFLGGLYVFRGLYDSIPFLLSIGLSAITAFFLVGLSRLAYRPHVRFQKFQWKTKGKLQRSGWFAIAVGVLYVTFLGHCTWIQFNSKEGTRYLEAAQEFYNSNDPAMIPIAETMCRKSRSFFLLAVGNGLWPIAEWESKLGSIAQFLGERDEAIRRFERALELDPNRKNTRISLLDNLRLAEDYTRYLREYEVLLPKVELSALSHLTAANAYAQDRDLVNSKAAFERVLAADPKNSLGRLNFGLLLAQEGDYDRGIAMLRSLTQDEPENGPAWQNLGIVQASSGDLASAQASLKQAVRLQPNLEGAWLTLIQISVQENNQQEAWNRAKLALKSNPKSPTIWQNARSLAESLSKVEEFDALGIQTP